MTTTHHPTWIAFAGVQRIAQGDPREVAAKAKTYTDAHPKSNLLIFDAQTSHVAELNLLGSLTAVLRRLPQAPKAAPAAALEAPAARTPGRPKLGVVPREVTLLPRHWEWLSTQPGGTSVALRKLVEQAQRANKATDQLRQAQEATYRFITTMAGDEPGYEEATRALFAGNLDAFSEHSAKWPRDVRKHALSLMEATRAGATTSDAA